jgi:stress-induced morphogen
VPILRQDLEEMLKEAFPDATLLIRDLAGDNDHWSVEIADNCFLAKSRMEQHRMVYAALKGKMGGELHALELKTTAKSA